MENWAPPISMVDGEMYIYTILFKSTPENSLSQLSPLPIENPRKTETLLFSAFSHLFSVSNSQVLKMAKASQKKQKKNPDNTSNSNAQVVKKISAPKVKRSRKSSPRESSSPRSSIYRGVTRYFNLSVFWEIFQSKISKFMVNH